MCYPKVNTHSLSHYCLILNVFFFFAFVPTNSPPTKYTPLHHFCVHLYGSHNFRGNPWEIFFWWAKQRQKPFWCSWFDRNHVTQKHLNTPSTWALLAGFKAYAHTKLFSLSHFFLHPLVIASTTPHGQIVCFYFTHLPLSWCILAERTSPRRISKYALNASVWNALLFVFSRLFTLCQMFGGGSNLHIFKKRRRHGLILVGFKAYVYTKPFSPSHFISTSQSSPQKTTRIIIMILFLFAVGI